MTYSLPPLTKPEYKNARARIDANQKAVRAWLDAHPKQGMTIETMESMPYHKEVTNELRSRVEVYEFCNDIPESYFLYINTADRQATTWTGENLGGISLGAEYWGNFGDKRQSITVYAINGATYHGTYYKSAGDYARVRRAKK